MNTSKVEPLTDPVRLGEGPHWDHEAQILYFVDVEESSIMKYDPNSKELTKANVDDGDGNFTSMIIPLRGEKNKFIISSGCHLSLITWDGKSSTPSNLKHLISFDKGEEIISFSDGKADSTGRLWAGTLCIKQPGQEGPMFVPEKGSLYSFSSNEPKSQLTALSIPNGMAWDDNNKLMFFTDSATHKIYAFNFDVEAGEITKKRVCFDFQKNNVKGMPDGMTIDQEGKLWIACVGGGQVIRMDPATETLLSQFPLPVPGVTSVAFGGSQLDELYVTSASEFLSEEELKLFPLSGSTFKISQLAAKGYPGQSVRI